MNAIPERALHQHIAVLGKTGAGKTFATKGAIVEPLLEAGKRVAIVDPTDAWFGLRSSASGPGEGFKILVLGGDHGDLPLTPNGGAAVARLVVEQGVNLVACTKHLMVGERTRWFIDFAGTISRLNRTPLHLVLDEAHNFAPQGKVPDPDTGRMLHIANALASEGRSKGIRLAMLTQRPQKLHKDMLTSADTLVAMRVLAPHDRKAVEEWIQGCGEPGKGKEVLNSLASLSRGEGWVWYPEGGYLQRVRFPRIKTFDSSATPEEGKVAATPRAAEIDLSEIQAALADAVKEAEANDPKLLRKKVSTLEAEIRELKFGLEDARRSIEEYQHTLEMERAAATPPKEVFVLAAEDRVGLAREAEIGLKNVEALEGYVSRLGHALTDQRDIVLRIEKILTLQAEQAQFPRAASPAPGSRTPAVKGPTAGPRPVDRSKSPADISRPQQGILDALAYFASIGVERPSRKQVALVARVSSVSSGYEKNVSTLSTLGLIGYPGPGLLQLTLAGSAYAKAPEEQPKTKDLQDALCARLSGPQAVLLRVLIKAYPNMLDRASAAQLAGVSAASSGFEKNVSTLRSLGLIDYPEQGHLAASPVLFLGSFS